MFVLAVVVLFRQAYQPFFFSQKLDPEYGRVKLSGTLFGLDFKTFFLYFFKLEIVAINEHCCYEEL